MLSHGFSPRLPYTPARFVGGGCEERLCERRYAGEAVVSRRRKVPGRPPLLVLLSRAQTPRQDLGTLALEPLIRGVPYVPNLHLVSGDRLSCFMSVALRAKQAAPPA